jgi:hypothetical protein
LLGSVSGGDSPASARCCGCCCVGIRGLGKEAPLPCRRWWGLRPRGSGVGAANGSLASSDRVKLESCNHQFKFERGQLCFVWTMSKKSMARGRACLCRGREQAFTAKELCRAVGLSALALPAFLGRRRACLHAAAAGRQQCVAQPTVGTSSHPRGRGRGERTRHGHLGRPRV